MVQVQITPLPTPRASPATSPVPTEHEHLNPREEPSLEVEEQKLPFNSSFEPTNEEHTLQNELPPVEVIDKSAVTLNGFAGHSKGSSREENLEMTQTTRHTINR